MKFGRRKSKTAKLIFISCALTALPAFGTISNCETGGTPDYTDITFGGTGNIDNGCRNIDRTFSSFTLSGVGFNGGGDIDGVPTSSQIGLNAIGVPGGTGTSALGIQLVDSTASGNQGNDWQVLANGAADDLQWRGIVDFVVRADPGTAFNHVTFSHSAIAVAESVGLTLSLRAQFCLGSTSFGPCPNGLVNIGNSAITTDVISQSYSSATVPVTDIAVRFIIFADLGTSDSVRGFILSNTSFQFDSVATSPEPATFGLIGIGLLGIGLVVRGRRERK